MSRKRRRQRDSSLFKKVVSVGMMMLPATGAFAAPNAAAPAASVPDSGSIRESQQTNPMDNSGISLGQGDIELQEAERPSLNLPDSLKVEDKGYR